MSSSVDVSTQTKSNEFLTIENIIADLSNLVDRLSQVKQSIPQCSSSNNSTGNDMLNRFDKLQGDDLNQVEEALKKLQKFEDGAGGVIKNLERCLDDFSKEVAKAPNDENRSKVVAEAPNDLSIEDKVSALKKDAKKLKMKFPLWPHKKPSTSLHQYSRPRNGSESDSEVDELRGLHVSHKFFSCSVFTEFQEVFKNLDIRLKLCLLSFSVLPANAVIKRRLLINWWVGECLVDPPATGEKTAEKIADEILKELEFKGFIEAVKKRHKQVADRFKMQPLVHRVVIMLAQDQLLNYDSKGNPTVRSSRCNRACLVMAEDGTSEQELAPNLYPEKLQTIFNVNEPFPDLRFVCSAKLKKVNIVEWFSKMKNLHVLYLGRWQSSDQNNKEEQISDQHHIEEQSSDRHNKGVQSSDRNNKEEQISDQHHIEEQSSDWHNKGVQSSDQNNKENQISDQHQIEEQSSDWHNKGVQSSDQHNKGLQTSDQSDIVWPSSLKNHIEVESTEFLKGLKNMKCLRLLSLQGISRINELPNSIGKLTNLRILDLKDCHNLEALPDGITSLKKLSHLDISGCYLLDDMPKGLASLSELQVLKGFVIGNLKSERDSCTLESLKKLKKLSKLSINTRSKNFPTDEQQKDLRKLEALQKLAIVWVVNSKKKENEVPGSVGTTNSDNKGDIRRQDSGAVEPARAPSQCNRQQPQTEAPGLGNLEKLELQSFPDSVTPNWLIPRELKSLKKLYIRGGNLKNLGQMQGNDKWAAVESLRLKYLEEFDMGKEELLISFPKLNFLEIGMAIYIRPADTRSDLPC